MTRTATIKFDNEGGYTIEGDDEAVKTVYQLIDPFRTGKYEESVYKVAPKRTPTAPTDAEKEALDALDDAFFSDIPRDSIRIRETIRSALTRPPAVSDDAKREALEWFEDLVTCSKLVSGQEPQARYIRAGILSGFYEVPSFGVDYLFNNTCSGLYLFDSKDGGDSKTMESHVRARFLQLLNWIAYNYPKGIKVVK